MATGDIVTYPRFRLGQMLGTANIAGLNLTDGNVKLAIYKSTWDPDADFTDIQFMNHASIALATYEVDTNVGYDGPIILANPTAVLNASFLPEFRADDITIDLDASGFTDGEYWVTYYDSGAIATSPAICFGHFGAEKSIVTSSLQIDFSNTGDAVNTLMRW